jgi:hypothetical protein
MGLNFKKCKNRIYFLFEGRDAETPLLSGHGGELLRNNEKRPQKPVVYTDGTWVHTHYTTSYVPECNETQQ